MKLHRIEVFIPLPGGFTHSRGYEWLPRSHGAWLIRMRMAGALDAEEDVLLAVWRGMDTCGHCSNQLEVAINQRRIWAGELRDQRRRMVPVLEPKVPVLEPKAAEPKSAEVKR